MAQSENQLKNEKSPYLQQHAENPVWWYPWGDEALNTAKKQNKLIFLSIGYSTCHWCHVMERESYVDHEVAKALNENFISIKIDREERPDVDAIYMDAVQAMTGSGGWPLHAILTPDRKPFFGGTYFRKPQLLEILRQISEGWQQEPEKISGFSKRLGEFLEDEHRRSNSGVFNDDIFSHFYNGFSENFDFHNGGKKGAPKFAPTYDLRVLLRIFRRSNDKNALAMVEKTLDHLSTGGIYDHLGGGFHRYSTDAEWLVPHFEKMLYDQAAFGSAFLEGFQVTKNPEYRSVVIETLDYVLRELTSKEGGFYSAEDADSESVEGKFYVWPYQDLKDALTAEEFTEVSKAYGVTVYGNFENENILNLQPGFSRAQRTPTLEKAFEKLRQVRTRRVHPSLDTKILTSWNGLMISLMAKSARVLGEPKYAKGAARAADFILNEVLDKISKQLQRRWAFGEAKCDPYDEDYAFLIDGLIELYQTDFNKKWLFEAARLQAEQDRLFLDKERSGYYFTTGSDKALLRRGKNYVDNVTPSGNSISVLNLLRLGDLFFDSTYGDRAAEVIKSFPEEVMKHPMAFSQLIMALDYSLDQSKEVAIVSASQLDLPARYTIFEKLAADFNPNQVLACGVVGENDVPLLRDRPLIDQKTTFYVCANRVCQLPTNEIDEAKRLIDEMKPLKIPV